jgi:Mce-associated membrane protein
MEGDAGTSQLNPTGQETDAPEDPVAAVVAEQDEDTEPEAPADDIAEGVVDGRRQERLGRGWFVGICAVLVLLAAGVGVGGYLALRSHDQSEAIARDDALAIARAKECVAATQAPDAAAMTASQSKILECSTGDFAVQANLFAGMLVDAYQVASVNVQVSDLRAAVERHNPDDSVDVLVAVRVKVTNSAAADQEQGYRLRVNMARADGTYKVAKLDQVTS